MSSLETQKMQLRASIKALEYKQSRLACLMANDLGVHGDFFTDQLDMNSRRVNPVDHQKYKIITSKLYIARDELEQLEYAPERYAARKKVFDFISDLPVDIVISVLRQCGCLTTLELVEKVIQYPSLLDEVIV